MTAPLESLLDALESVIEARAELKSCQKNCEYDAGYFCFAEIHRLESAKSRFGDELRQYIILTMDESNE